jgi:glucans biosynthesis protein
MHHKLQFGPAARCSAMAERLPGHLPVSRHVLSPSVQMHVLETVSPVRSLYAPDYFNMPEDSPARRLPPDANGFAGFWILESRFADERRRRSGPVSGCLLPCCQRVGQWGCRRGVALVSVAAGPRVPGLIAHWITAAASEDEPMVVLSLLDGPSLAGTFGSRSADHWHGHGDREASSCARTSSAWGSRR